MSPTEVLVVVCGLVLGYWVVSLFVHRKPAEPREPDRQDDAPSADARRRTQAHEDAGTPLAWHQVLEVDPGASAEEIRLAYRSLIGKYHPDKVASLGSELKQLAERKSAEITAAYRDAMRLRGVDA